MTIRIITALLLISGYINAQDAEPVRIFYDTRVVHGHSTEVNEKSKMKFIISHRFGRISGGAYELWGLDNSTIRLGLDYGVTKKFTMGIGRSSFEKTYDGFLKYNFVQQSNGEDSSPLSITALTGMAIRGTRFTNEERFYTFEHRISYNFNLLIARRFSDRFSAQLMPSLVHRNIVSTPAESNDVIAMGASLRYLLTKRLTINLEYYYTLPDQLASDYKNSLALGFDLETKGHVFQFHLGNSRGMIEKFFITETTGDWLKNQIHFGFNISRDFKVGGRSY